jgi:hypothetical protein
MARLNQAPVCDHERDSGLSSLTMIVRSAWVMQLPRKSRKATFSANAESVDEATCCGSRTMSLGAPMHYVLDQASPELSTQSSLSRVSNIDAMQCPRSRSHLWSAFALIRKAVQGYDGRDDELYRPFFLAVNISASITATMHSHLSNC